MVFEYRDMVQHIVEVGGVEAAVPMRGVNRLGACVARASSHVPTLSWLLYEAARDVRRVFPELYESVDSVADWAARLRMVCSQRVLRRCVVVLPQSTLELLDLTCRRGRIAHYYDTRTALQKALRATDGMWGLLSRRARSREGRRLPHTPVRYSAAQRESLRALAQLLPTLDGLSAQQCDAIWRCASQVV